MKDQLKVAMIAAMKAKDTLRLTTIRMAIAAVKQKEIDDGPCDDAAVLGILQKMIKQRQDAAEQYQQADRRDLADKELAEAELLTTFCPAMLTNEELQTMVKQVIQDMQANSMKDMGKVMAAIKAQSEGRADMSKVGPMVKAALG